MSVRAHGVAGPVEILDVAYRVQVQTPDHSHDWDSLHLVLAGCVAETYRGARRLGGPGTLLLYRAGTPHRTRVAGNARIIHLPLAAPPLEGNGDWEQRVTAPDSTVYWEVVRIAGLALIHDQAAPSESECAGTRLIEALDTTRREPPPDERACHAANLVWSTRCTPPLHHVARTCGTSCGHLARLFRAAYGCSVGQMSRRRQVATAARLLLENSDRSLAGIAAAAGFSDQSHLGRVFRASTGVTPHAFRRVLGRSAHDSR